MATDRGMQAGQRGLLSAMVSVFERTCGESAVGNGSREIENEMNPLPH